MKLPRRNFLHLAAGAAALPAMSRLARAQAYPVRPVRLLIGFAPGGTQDVIGRLLGHGAPEDLIRSGHGRGRQYTSQLQHVAPRKW